eukprot:5262120-Alexandrium_andersonii.AAC.1
MIGVATPPLRIRVATSVAKLPASPAGDREIHRPDCARKENRIVHRSHGLRAVEHTCIAHS